MLALKLKLGKVSNNAELSMLKESLGKIKKKAQLFSFDGVKHELVNSFNSLAERFKQTRARLELSQKYEQEIEALQARKEELGSVTEKTGLINEAWKEADKSLVGQGKHKAHMRLVEERTKVKKRLQEIQEKIKGGSLQSDVSRETVARGSGTAPKPAKKQRKSDVSGIGSYHTVEPAAKEKPKHVQPSKSAVSRETATGVSEKNLRSDKEKLKSQVTPSTGSYSHQVLLISHQIYIR